MYRIMLVDDDSFFASMFTNSFGWDEEGFYVVCHAENGQSAIDLLHQYTIDLAFIDMCMPGMNGAELISYIASEFPGVACVALSSYDDFDFVKESFRAGAIDYILKHCLNRVEMIRILTTFREKKGLTEKPVNVQPVSMDMFPTAVCRYFTALFEGKYIQTDDDFLLPDSIGIPQISRNILLAKITLEQYSGFCKKYLGLNKLPFMIRSICSILQNITDRLAIGIVFFHPDDKCFYAVMTDDRFCDDQFFSHKKGLLQQQICNSIKRYFNVNSIVATSPLCSYVKDIHYAYTKLNFTTTADLQKAELRPGMDTQSIYEHSLYAIKRYLTDWNAHRLRRYVAGMFEDARNKELMLHQYVEISVTLGRVYMESCDHFQAEGLPCPDFAKIIDMRNSTDMESYILALFDKLFIYLRNKNTAPLSAHVLDALKIIQDQLDATTLSLAFIASHLHINANYLSRIFNSEMNVGITEYINRHRVQHAADLLLIEHISAKDAAQRCGFENYTYFFRVFKKYIGKTPMEYSKQDILRQKSD